MANKKKPTAIREEQVTIPTELTAMNFYGLDLDEDQKNFVRTIFDPDIDIVFCNARSGSGKTVTALGASKLLVKSGQFTEIQYLMIPHSEKESRCGYRPGSVEEKLAPYFFPLYDAAPTLDINPFEDINTPTDDWKATSNGYVVPRDCYNSYFYKVEDETCNLLDKLVLHGRQMTKYLDGGSALHANLEEHLSFEQYKKIMENAILTGCPYFTFNIPNTICNDCGYISKHKLDHCPQCGSEHLDYATRVIGYLKRVSKFSEARQKEAENRYYAKP